MILTALSRLEPEASRTRARLRRHCRRWARMSGEVMRLPCASVGVWLWGESEGIRGGDNGVIAGGVLGGQLATVGARRETKCAGAGTDGLP